MDRPMTTSEFFDRICGILKAGGMMPDIIDYARADSHGIPIRTCEFELKNCFHFGGSEGLCLELWIEYEAGSGKAGLGTFRSRHDDRSAMRAMSVLMTDFTMEGYDYVRKNIDDFSWEGFQVYVPDDTGKKSVWYYECSSEEEALARKDALLGVSPAVTVRDNRTKNERTYRADRKHEQAG